MQLYTDRPRTKPSSKQLDENATYYIDFEDANDELIEEEISTSKLGAFINWEPGNRIAKLKITNFIGNVCFFEATYDVQSKKFLHGLSGAEQFQAVLSEIHELSSNITFTYHSPSFVVRNVDYTDLAPSLLLIFNYFKNVILNWPKHINLLSDFERIARNPHFKYSHDYQMEKIEKIKKINAKTLKSMVQNNKHHVRLSSKHSHLLDLPIVNMLSQSSREKFFPTKAIHQKKHLSFDTDENRFVKFFFEYIESIANQVGGIRGLPDKVVDEKNQLLSFCRSILIHPFFREIGTIRTIPSNSSVLQNRIGYQDVFNHFNQSRFGIKHVFNDFEKEALSVDMKRISDIYEYWVFYKIAIALLGRDITIKQQEAVIKDGELTYSVCFSNSEYEVHYNSTVSRGRRSAYSVSLRPDVTVMIKHGDETIRLVFDAKYKVNKQELEDGSSKYYVKPEDIHKMHAYLDAIHGCKFAIVVYPGSEFCFYEKADDGNMRQDTSSVESWNGVGAIPMIPNNPASDILLSKLLHSVIKELSPE